MRGNKAQHQNEITFVSLPIHPDTLHSYAEYSIALLLECTLKELNLPLAFFQIDYFKAWKQDNATLNKVLYKFIYSSTLTSLKDTGEQTHQDETLISDLHINICPVPLYLVETVGSSLLKHYQLIIEPNPKVCLKMIFPKWITLSLSYFYPAEY